jgi:hypothetical protein
MDAVAVDNVAPEDETSVDDEDRSAVLSVVDTGLLQSGGA